MAQKTEQLALRHNHGHTDTHVVVQFSMQVNNLVFTPDQAREFIKGVERSIEMLTAHQAKLAQGKQGANG